ncbi:sodium/hydrogen exchanger [Elysia marginata]|uniref:Sodium/hydrogen exchanger n=1 Tax=Elysia marginata TaxID=1093978 RepID=A0AAV4GA03_9GAST|nr:sodium/hydrogen exchanger [Elysia marginata]
METTLLILVFVVLSILVGVTVRALLKNTAIPYSVALLVFGLLLGLMSQAGYIREPIEEINLSIRLGAALDPNLILFIFLPALVFESAFELEVHLFKRMFSQIALLAVPGLVICTCMTAFMVLWLLPWEWSFPVALMFGAIVSATDPVAVVALLKEMCSRARLQTLIEGESLINDGTAIVLFSLFLTLATQLNAEMHIPTVVFEFFRVVFLGIILGCLVGAVSLIFINRVFNDSLIEITLTLVTPYLVFYVAEHVFHASGIVAVVTLALIYAGPGRTCFSPEVIHHLHHFWQTLAYLFNTLIFILVGLVVATRVTDASLDSWGYLFVIFLGVLIIRSLAVWIVPKWIEYMASVPLIRRYATQYRYMQQVLVYESARGLLAANRQTITLAKSISMSEKDRDAALSDMERNIQLGEEALDNIKSLSPEIVAKIETHTALRILLNKQRNSLTALSHEGVISEVDAEKLVSEVEFKMHRAGQDKLS